MPVFPIQTMMPHVAGHGHLSSIDFVRGKLRVNSRGAALCHDRLVICYSFNS
jgi:hypothetical protein